MSARTLVAIAFLGLQAVLVAGSMVGEARWFSWAPHAVQVQYDIEASAAGQTLDDAAIRRRFGIPASGWEAHAVRNVQDIIVRYGRSQGRHEDLQVLLTHSKNGRRPETWRWPDDSAR